MKCFKAELREPREQLTLARCSKALFLLYFFPKCSSSALASNTFY